jgi:hypothetical protein
MNFDSTYHRFAITGYVCFLIQDRLVSDIPSDQNQVGLWHFLQNVKKVLSIWNFIYCCLKI